MRISDWSSDVCSSDLLDLSGMSARTIYLIPRIFIEILIHFSFSFWDRKNDKGITRSGNIFTKTCGSKTLSLPEQIHPAMPFKTKFLPALVEDCFNKLVVTCKITGIPGRKISPVSQIIHQIKRFCINTAIFCQCFSPDQVHFCNPDKWGIISIGGCIRKLRCKQGIPGFVPSGACKTQIHGFFFKSGDKISAEGTVATALV